MNTALVDSGSIVDGPKKEDVMIGLTDNPVYPDGPTGRRMNRYVTFRAKDASGQEKDLRINIRGIELEDASGNILNIAGFLAIEMRRDLQIKVCYDTNSRKGTYSVIDPTKEREGRLCGLRSDVRVGDELQLHFHESPIQKYVTVKKVDVRGKSVVAHCSREDEGSEESDFYPCNLIWEPGQDHAEYHTTGPGERLLLANELPVKGNFWTVRTFHVSKDDGSVVEFDIRVNTVSKVEGDVLFITGHFPGGVSIEATVNTYTGIGENRHDGVIKLIPSI